jgi:iron complex outermembrane recepter protein
MKKIMMLLFSTCFCYGLSAQTYLLNGVITDDFHHPLAGISVKLSSTNLFTISDSSGRFAFQLPNGQYELKINAIGFHPVKNKVVIKDKPVQLRLKLASHPHLLNEVTIKSKSIDDRKQEQSLNVEAVKADFIQRHLGGSLMSTLQRLPGIKTIGIGSGQSKPLIRGLGFNRVVVVDKGIKHEGQQWGADHGLEIDQFAAEEIELIKGAASFVYGADAIGGAINIKAPTLPAPDNFGGDVNLIGKTNNSLYGTSIHLFQRKEKLFFDGRFTYQNYGDYRVPTDTLFVYDFAVGLHKNYLRNTAGRETGIHFNTGYVTEKFKTILFLSNTYSKSGFFANAHGLEPRRVDASIHDASTRDILMPYQQVNHFKLINKSTWILDNHNLELELGYQHNFRQEYNHYVNHGYMPPVYPNPMNIPIDLEREFDKQVYAFNAKDQITLGKHILQIGINGELQDNVIGGWSFLVPAFKQESLGAYAYDKYKLNDKVLLHGAIRYDVAQMSLLNYTDWFFSETADGPMEKLVRANNLSRNFNSFVWSVGMNYNFDQLGFKANIGKSFRIPIAKELGANGVNYHYFSYEKGNPGLSPEQSYQADFSISLNTGKLTAGLSPFFNYFPNYIYLNPSSAHDYFYGAGNQVFEYAQSRVMRYGGEVQVKYQLSGQWSTEVLAEYLYAEQLSGDKKGYTLPFSPPASALLKNQNNTKSRANQ